MCGIFHEEDAFFHPAQIGENLLERADAVDRTQVRPDDERVDVAALDVQPPQQFGCDDVSALQHGSDAGQFRRSVGYHMNRHDFPKRIGRASMNSGPERALLTYFES